MRNRTPSFTRLTGDQVVTIDYAGLFEVQEMDTAAQRILLEGAFASNPPVISVNQMTCETEVIGFTELLCRGYFNPSIDNRGYFIPNESFYKKILTRLNQQAWQSKAKPILLEEAIEIAREVEREVVPQGWHVALGGGVLIRGQSSKDVDLYLYRHKKNPVDDLNLPKIDIPCLTFVKQHNLYGEDAKTVIESFHTGTKHRVDLIFL